MAFIVNYITLPWILTSLGLGAMIIVGLILLIAIFKMTHAPIELKAKFKGRKISVYLEDGKGVKFSADESSAGLVQNEKYGTFIESDKGTYLDRDKKLAYQFFSANVAMGASAKLFKASDDLYKVLGDEVQLAEIRRALADGTMNPEELGEFEALKESIDFSHFKSLMNAILPHNLSAKISMEVAKRLNSYGKTDTKAFVWFVVVGIGLIALAGLMFYLVTGHDGGTTTIIQQAPAVQPLANATVSRIAG